ncbi:VWA domain-containing protein [Microvenator marinus]|uniref:VWA domain-containing protein n=1 Tax=Microvenator marinus TaxID=2600177 RepID=A0A5B8XXP1_9DELT|nr:VWA domain-containing protein [Microvenator marinus]QED29957.1 VWA domain-containing protein [Microvenator marinus]
MNADAGSFLRHYSYLEDCPLHLVKHIFGSTLGSIEDRVRGVVSWRNALLKGEVPECEPWPGEVSARPVIAALEVLQLQRFFRNEAELVDEFLIQALEAFERREQDFTSAILAALQELEELQRRELEDDEDGVTDEDLELVRQLAEEVARESLGNEPDTQIMEKWQERERVWSEIMDAFGSLGNMLGRGWDLSRGIIRQTGWTEIAKLRRIVAELPQLEEIVLTLGRMQASDDEEKTMETIFAPVSRLEEELREIRTPWVPAQTRGVERSGDIARMLPSEAAYLGHPTLRLLWHARRAERALITYRVEGIELERHAVEVEVQEEMEREVSRPQRGPIIVALDTSGSMAGAPELVAKALVLEALRRANLEKRRCYVYAYGGPNDVVEHELAVSDEGIGRLLQFLGFSFHGGTDIGAVHRVLERLEDDAWTKADVLIVSDGEWRAPADLSSAVQIAKEENHRFHGVQVGSSLQSGMHTICDPVHIFKDWLALHSATNR